MDTLLLAEHLQPKIAYIKCIWQIFKSDFYFKGALKATLQWIRYFLEEHLQA